MTADEILQSLYEVLGDAVLLPIPIGKKGPGFDDWQKVTFTESKARRAELIGAVNRGGNIGVLLGPPSNRLLALDLDDDDLVDQWLTRSPWLANTLRSKGRRGCQFWLRLEGGCDYPNGKAVYKFDRLGQEPARKEDAAGEIRLGGAGGAQSVIFGQHPAGMRYEILVDKPPLVISLADLDELAPGILFASNEPVNHEVDGSARPATNIWDRVTRYLDECPAAVSGERGHDTTFGTLCAVIRHFDLSDDQAWQAAIYYNRKCEPPWSEKDLRHKVDDSWKATQNEMRGDFLKDDSETSFSRKLKVEQRQGGAAPDEHTKEHELADLLEGSLPPIRCVGRDWYRYEDGVWRRGTKDIFRPQALSIQYSKTRTDRMASNILGHIESKFQVAEKTFCSFYRFDAGAILINCANGVLRITPDIEHLLSHSPDYLFTGQVSASFDAKAEAPTFNKVLMDALPDPEDLALFRLFVGYILYPGCPFEAALVCYGDGGTGKSTIAEGVRAALGDDLVCSLSLLQICDPKSFHLVNLRNAAVNICTELDALPIMSADNFKLLVSGEQVSADRKHQELISLKTSCKFLFLTNYLPRFQHGTDAELRRLRFLRFERRPQKPDPSLKQRIALERDGVFRFAVEGLRTLLAMQEIPQGGQQSKETRERFKVQNDPIAGFVRACCRIDPNAEILKSEIYEEYKSYLSTNGLPEPANDSWFFRALYNRFPIKELRRRDGNHFVRKITGIELCET